MVTEQPPTPTTGLSQCITDLESSGYCYLADALSTAEVLQLQQRLSEQAQAEEQHGIAYKDGAPDQNWGDFRDEQGELRPSAFDSAAGGSNQRIWMLVNKGQPFVDLLQHSDVRNIVSSILGDEYILSSHIANIARAGGVAMQLHTDQWWMPPPTRPNRRHLPAGSISRTRFDIDEIHGAVISPPVVVNVLWMLDPFTEGNGATRLVPESHLLGRQPDPDAISIAATASAGTALVVDGRTWHGTGANIGGGERRAILTTFCAPQFRPQENYTVGTRSEVLARADDDLRTLLGFKIWNAYGRTGHPTDKFISPGVEPTGKLSPT
jgi:ectoine hydroxylase-related dioxygenase (phytanoyl-CoA dioxygenase family)